PCPQSRLHANGRLNLLEITIFDVLLNLRSNLAKSWLLDDAVTWRFRLATNELHDLRRIFQNLLGREVEKVPLSDSDFDGPLVFAALFGIFSQFAHRKRIAKENRAHAGLRMLFSTEDTARKLSQSALKLGIVFE